MSAYVPPHRREKGTEGSTPPAPSSGPDHLGSDHLDFRGVSWRPRGNRVEAHAPWVMTRGSLEEGHDEIVRHGSSGNLYRLAWSRRMMEEFGEREQAKSWKEGSILFEFDPVNRVGHVFHSGPGG